MEKPDREDIWLADLKFASRPQEEEAEDLPQEKSRSKKHSGTALLRGQAAAPRGSAQPGVGKSNLYDQLAADKPEERLTRDSKIWKLYANEAKVYDEDLVSENNAYLDLMLVFGTLFSAIVTAFLIDSKNMMTQDAADTSNLLLMRIAERLENPTAPLAPADIPVFTPSSSARWINGLWFTALATSLSAIFIAILAKEWLDTFRTSRLRLVYPSALMRQARLDALDSWLVLHIIEAIALFMHVALLLFFLGLTIYLYAVVDTAIATIVTLCTGSAALFYLITFILGTLYADCPFGTHTSRCTRRMLDFVVGHLKYLKRRSRYFCIKWFKPLRQTSEEDLQALNWLANNAKDPQVVDSAYHALAGLPSELASIDGPHAIPGRNEEVITSMFVDVCQRLREAPASDPQELEVSCGVSVARYAATLPRLVHYLQLYPNQRLLAKLAGTRGREIGADYEVFDPPRQAFNALDSILDNTCPPFAADAYAWITSSELRLITDIAGLLNPTPRLLCESDLTPQKQYSSTAIGTMIEILHQVHDNSVDIFELRARYSRSLARASFQMFFHFNNRAPMSSFSLISLLESLEKATQCDNLNQTARDDSIPQERRLSTHHPQKRDAPSTFPKFNISLWGASDSYELRPGEIGDPCGLIAGILNILGASGSRNAVGVEIAAANALNRVAPMLIKQLLGPTTTFSASVGGPTGRGAGSTHIGGRMNNTSQHGVAPQVLGTNSSEDLNVGWPIHNPDLSITHWSLRQMIVLAAFAKRRQDDPGIGELSRISLRAFDQMSQSCLPRSTAFTIASTHLYELKYLIDNFDAVESSAADADSANTHLLQILALKEDKTVYSNLLADKLSGPSQLLKVMNNAFALPTTIETLLADVSDSALSNWPYFADLKNDDEQGLSQLLELGKRRAYRSGVARCISQIVRTAAAPTPAHPSGPGFTVDALPVFLEATRFVLNHHASDPKNPLGLCDFVDDMFKVIRAFDPRHDELITKHIPREEVERSLCTISKNTRVKNQVQKDLERFKYPDAIMSTGKLKSQPNHEREDEPASQDGFETQRND